MQRSLIFSVLTFVAVVSGCAHPFMSPKSAQINNNRSITVKLREGRGAVAGTVIVANNIENEIQSISQDYSGDVLYIDTVLLKYDKCHYMGNTYLNNKSSTISAYYIRSQYYPAATVYGSALTVKWINTNSILSDTMIIDNLDQATISKLINREYLLIILTVGGLGWDPEGYIVNPEIDPNLSLKLALFVMLVLLVSWFVVLYRKRKTRQLV